MLKIIENIKQTIKDEKIIIACSTGSDSMCLLNLVTKALKKEQIIIAHVNHNIRTQSQQEEEFIKTYAKQNTLQIETIKLEPIQQNFEATARTKRYEFFLNAAAKHQAKYILLAHHADDNLETIIMRLLKGSSLKGYAGIEETTFFKNTILFRPLLKISKSKILEYVNNNNITYFDDYTNYQDMHLRNRIRKYITPLLLEENPNLYDAITYFSKTILGADELLEQEITLFIKQYVTYEKDTTILKYKYLLSKNDFLINQILFRILKPYSLSRYMIEEIIKILKAKKNKIITTINQSLTIIKEYDSLIITSVDTSLSHFYLRIQEEGIYDLPNDSKIIVNKNNCYFLTGTSKICYNILGLPIIIRNRLDGDVIKRKNKNKEYHQKVNDILTNRKISYLQRINTLVITTPSDEVIGILGLTIS